MYKRISISECSDRSTNAFVKLLFVGNMAKRVEKAIDMRVYVVCRNYVHKECVEFTSKNPKNLFALHVQLKKTKNIFYRKIFILL